MTLAACTPSQADTQGDSDSSSSASSRRSVSSVRETNNVSYQGIVRPAGISIFMEGTHRLELDTEKFILLESDSIDLNGYVGESVQVFGSIRPTAESDAVIMTVTDISLQHSSAESISSDESSDDSSTSSESSVSSEESSESSTTTSESAASSSDSLPAYSEAFDARIAAMASEDVTPARWTQLYCTSHIGFCIPVHKNWWFQSFGATSTDFWHVEMNNEPLDTIHDGPIAVRLVPGTVASVGAEDGQVLTKGNTVTGYRSWTDGRHFEIVGDVRLESSIRYITDSLQVYTEE